MAKIDRYIATCTSKVKDCELQITIELLLEDGDRIDAEMNKANKQLKDESDDLERLFEKKDGGNDD